MIAITSHPLGALISVRAQPGARKDAILGERDGRLRVAVTAAPDKGKANAAIVAVLAEILSCRRSEISLLMGETSRDKAFLVAGQSPESLKVRLVKLVFP